MSALVLCRLPASEALIAGVLRVARVGMPGAGCDLVFLGDDAPTIPADTVTLVLRFTTAEGARCFEAALSVQTGAGEIELRALNERSPLVAQLPPVYCP